MMNPYPPEGAGNAGANPTNPSWQGQPVAPQQTPGWMGQNPSMPFGMQPTAPNRSTSWPALTLIARILKIIAWIVLGFTVIAAIAVAFTAGQASPFLGFVFFIGTLLVGSVYFLGVYGTAEMIQVLLAIEKNTRKNE